MKKFRAFLTNLYQVWINERPTQLAAAMAYYGMFSFVPVVYIAFSFVQFVGSKFDLLGAELETFISTLDPEVYNLLSDALTNLTVPSTSGTILGAIIGFAALLFAASGLFFQLQFALNSIWKVPPPKKGGTRQFVLQRGVSIIMVIAIGLLLIAVLGINILINWFQSMLWVFLDRTVPLQVINNLVLIAVLFSTLLLVYKFIPNRKIAWRDAMIGAGVGTVLILIASFIFRWLLGSGSFSSSFKAAGSLALILIGIYYFAQIILLGAVVSRVSEETLKKTIAF